MTRDDTEEAKLVVASVRAALTDYWSRDAIDSAELDRAEFGSRGDDVPEFDDEGSVSWARVREIADGNAVLPLVTDGLERLDRPVADAVRTDFQAGNRHNAAQNLVLADALEEVLEALDAAGVRAIPYKGPVLATTGYGDLTRRSFGDVDVLIPPDRRDAAKSAVESLGYERIDPYSVPAIDRSRVLRRTLNEYGLRRADDDATVELRWEFDTPRLPSFDTFWDRRVTTTVAETEMPALSPVDVLVVQTTHAAKHACRRLAWVADVAAAAARLDDWDTFLGVVADRDLGYRASVALRLASELFEPPVPERVWSDRRLPDCRDVAMSAYERWLDSPVDTTSLLDEFRFDLQLFPPAKAVRSIGDTVFRPRHDEYDALPLPPALHPLYYVYRPVRLAWIYALRPWR